MTYASAADSNDKPRAHRPAHGPQCSSPQPRISTTARAVRAVASGLRERSTVAHSIRFIGFRGLCHRLSHLHRLRPYSALAASAIAFPPFLPSPQNPIPKEPHKLSGSVHVQTDDKRLYSSRKEREREDQSVVRTQLSTQLRNREPKASQ